MQHTRAGVAQFFARFRRDERGASLTEYALITAIFGITMLASLYLFTSLPGKNLNRTSNSLTNMSYVS